MCILFKYVIKRQFTIERHTICTNSTNRENIEEYVPTARICITPDAFIDPSTGALDRCSKVLASIWIRWLYKPLLVKRKYAFKPLNLPIAKVDEILLSDFKAKIKICVESLIDEYNLNMLEE